MSAYSQPLKKSNNRWKWMAGATVATAAASTAPSADAATITLINNYIDHTVSNLNPDLTGDGNADVVLDTFYTAFATSNPSSSRFNGYARVWVKNFTAAFLGVGVASFSRRFTSTTSYSYRFRRAFAGGGLGAFASQSSFAGASSQPVSTKISLIPVSFTDLSINGGLLTNGFLEIEAFAHLGSTLGSSTARVQLNSLTYDEIQAPVPEPGSLALLALGAAGLAVRRRQRNSA